MIHRPLLDRAPSIPWLELAHLPTPVRRVEASDDLPVPIWLKDDGRSGALYGGNKTRKLEFLFGDAFDQQSPAVWTLGAAGSNHVMATSTYARELGVRCEVLHFPQPPTDHVRKNVAGVVSNRAKLHYVPSFSLLPTAVTLMRMRAALRRPSRRTYFIPGGGTSAVGCLGYVNAALELGMDVEEGRADRPTRVYVAAGTAGTLTGLIVGFALLGWHDVEIHGVRVTPLSVCNGAIVKGLVHGVRSLLREHGLSVSPKLPRWRLRDDVYGEGYGIPTESGVEAIQIADASADLYLEPTYTAKCFAACVADARSGALDGHNALYWHTLNQQDLLPRIRRPFGRDDVPRAYRRYFEDENGRPITIA